MPREDRERNFEKALAQNLRAGSPACPDAETLASYHERLLAPEQMAASKEHVAGCSRCQQILAQLESTDDLLLESFRPGSVTSIAAQAARPPMPEPAPSVQPGASIGGQRPVVLQPPSSRHWRWFAPAGALAAGLLVWIAIHESRPKEFQLARNQRDAVNAPVPAVPPAPPVSQTYAPSSDDRSARLEAQAPAQKPSAGRLDAPKDAKTVPNDEVDRDASREESAAANATGRVRQSEVAKSAQQALSDRATKESAAGNKVAGVAGGALSSAPAAAPAPPAELSPGASAGGGAVDSETRKEKEADTGAVAALKKDSAIADKQPSARNTVVVSAVSDTKRILITSPTRSVMWRIGSGGIIERSSDSGTTWSIQPSGVVNDLLAGSCTSDLVCWLVGRAGTVLRTTDGGTHWQKLPFPVADDLAAVFAVNADRATVSPTQDAYQTTDGGRTWTRLAPQ